jgi:hypothetical protein
MKFYFKQKAQEMPQQQEATEDEIGKVLNAFSNENVTEMSKFLQTKLVNPYYHNWFLDAILDPSYIKADVANYNVGPEEQYETVGKFPQQITDLFNLFIRTQNPSQGEVQAFLNQNVYWYNPHSEKNEIIKLKDAM